MESPRHTLMIGLIITTFCWTHLSNVSHISRACLKTLNTDLCIQHFVFSVLSKINHAYMYSISIYTGIQHIETILDTKSKNFVKIWCLTWHSSVIFMHLNEALLGVGKIKFTLRSYPGIFVTLIIATAATSNAEHVKNKQEKI